jgi:ABC-type glycerol-3-phosphate transport system substrate-binding protein
MRRFLIFAIIVFLLTGCANIDLSALLPTPQAAAVPSDTPVPVIATVTPVTPTVTPSGPRTLRLWVPPQFDPSAETTAAALLQERLDEFDARRPDLLIDVRGKAESGTSGLLNALAVTKSAAPSIMPDLVALSRADLVAAAATGLIHPLDGLTDLPEESDWFPYARQMARIQNSSFGLPFAGDALVLIGLRNPLPTTWNDLQEGMLLVFPAADPQALFTLSLYLSAGGTLQDSQGRLALNEAVLTNVLSFYSPDAENNFISPQVTNYEDEEQAWEAFRELRGNLVTGWTSQFLSEGATPLVLAPLPGFNSNHYSLATGWSWAMASNNPENQALAVELAEFLTDSQFLAEWTRAAGYLPTRPTALALWEDVRGQLALTQTAELASLIPTEDLLARVGPLFSEATLSVLNEEQSPEEAAQFVIEQLQ